MNLAAPSTRRIVEVYFALLALLAMTALATLLPPGYWSTPIAVGIAAAKTALIFAYFMRLREQSGLVRIFAFAGFFWLAILVGLAITDFLTRGRPL